MASGLLYYFCILSRLTPIEISPRLGEGNLLLLVTIEVDPFSVPLSLHCRSVTNSSTATACLAKLKGNHNLNMSLVCPYDNPLSGWQIFLKSRCPLVVSLAVWHCSLGHMQCIFFRWFFCCCSSCSPCFWAQDGFCGHQMKGKGRGKVQTNFLRTQ